MTPDRATVLVVGSLHYDIMVDAPHLPQRDETVAGSRWYPKFGGKGGNQAVAAARTGAVSRMVGAVGQDDFGVFLRAALCQGKVDDHYVRTVSGIGSGISVAIADAAGDYAAVIVSGSNLAIDPLDLQEEAVWHGVGVLVLQNEISEAINLAAALEARRRGVQVVLNAAPMRVLSAGFAKLVDVLVVNAVEAEMLGAGAVGTLGDATIAAALLARQFPAVVVTAGGAGLAAFEARGGGFSIPAEKIIVQSTHGAGDVFTGTLAATLAAGGGLEAACRAGSQAAAAHVAGR